MFKSLPSFWGSMLMNGLPLPIDIVSFGQWPSLGIELLLNIFAALYASIKVLA
jgi:hypothetical protein